MRTCESCDPPCSYKEENKSGVCPFRGDAATSQEEAHTFPIGDACCPMFELFDVFCNGIWYWDDPVLVPGNFHLGEDFFGDFSDIKVSGNFVIDGQVSTMSINVGGDLIVNGILDTDYENISVGGNLIIKGEIKYHGDIIVKGDIFLP